MTKVFKKWWLAKIAASIHFKDQSYSACFFYMAGRLDYWKCQKKEWSAKMLSFHHSLKLRYMFAKQVASIGIQWAISPPLPFYQGLMSEPPSPMDWMLPKATPKMAVFRDHKRGKKKRLHWTGWNLKKMGWQQFFFPEIFGWLKEMKMIQWSWLPESCHLTKIYQSVLTDLECVQRCHMPKSRCPVRNGNPKWGKMATLTHCKWKNSTRGWRQKPFDFNSKEIQRNMRMAIR